MNELTEDNAGLVVDTLTLQGLDANDIVVAEISCTPEPTPDTTEWINCLRSFAEDLAEALMLEAAAKLNDPNDKITLKAFRGERLLCEHTCRPAPAPDSPEWAACLRAFADKLKAAQS